MEQIEKSVITLVIHNYEYEYSEVASCAHVNSLTCYSVEVVGGLLVGRGGK